MTLADIQRALNARGYDPGPVDGAMGPRTGAALAAFQHVSGLVADGVPGPRTQAALGSEAEAVPVPRNPAPPPAIALSVIGKAVLVAREGRRLKAYRDSVGVWTIGVGHTSSAGPPVVRPGLGIDVAECDVIFSRDVVRFVRTVHNALPAAEKPPQHAFDALVSLCFNIGPSAFLRSSVLKRLRAGDRDGAAEAILMWNRPAEIFPRRQAEYDQFRTPYETALPRARRGDARPVRVPKARAQASREPAPSPEPPPSPGPPPLPGPPLPVPAAFPAQVGWLSRLLSRLSLH